jgi:hypothetical protein
LTQIPSDDSELLSAEIRVPEHVAIRNFDHEAVALNLRSGNYHSLNGVAADMFERLREATTAAETVDPLVDEYQQDRELIERDLADLLRGLIERGLVELRGGAPEH